MDLEDGSAPVEVGKVDINTAVEAAGAKEGVVEDIDAVGGGDDDHARVTLKAVHLREDLVEGLRSVKNEERSDLLEKACKNNVKCIACSHLLALIVTTSKTGATLPSDGVNLINEDNTRRVLLSLPEEVPDAAGTNTNEHLNEF